MFRSIRPGYLLAAVMIVAACMYGKSATVQAAAPSEAPLKCDIHKDSCHVVVAGQSLFAIATEHGERCRWQDIAKVNGIRKPYVIHPGQSLYLPATCLSTTEVFHRENWDHLQNGDRYVADAVVRAPNGKWFRIGEITETKFKVKDQDPNNSYYPNEIEVLLRDDGEFMMPFGVEFRQSAAIAYDAVAFVKEGGLYASIALPGNGVNVVKPREDDFMPFYAGVFDAASNRIFLWNFWLNPGNNPGTLRLTPVQVVVYTLVSIEEPDLTGYTQMSPYKHNSTYWSLWMQGDVQPWVE